MITDIEQNTLVMKFGGTSVGTVEAISQVLKITHAASLEWANIIIVASAFSEVTNYLLGSAKAAAHGDLSIYQSTVAELRDRHFSALSKFTSEQFFFNQINQHLQQFSDLIQAIHALGEVSLRALDSVAAFGERLSVIVLSAALQSSGLNTKHIDASQLIRTNEEFQNALPDLKISAINTRKVLLPLLENNIIPVVTGFIGSTESGAVTTLGRGGSDYTASLLASFLTATEVWIWTDVDGVMTADPKVIPEAVTIPEISYQEVSELAYYGAKVLHPKSIRPVIEADIPLRVRNTFNPDSLGTLITKKSCSHNNPTIVAVTAFRGINLIIVEGRGMLGVPGMAARMFSSVAKTGATVPLITEASSEQSICFAVPSVFTKNVTELLEADLSNELANHNIDNICASDEVAIITVVCPGMHRKLGVAGQVFSTLGEAGVNILAISHGSSEVSISMVVEIEDCRKTVQALHKLTISSLE